MHEVLDNRLGGLSLPRKSVVRLTDLPGMTIVVYRGRKITLQQYNNNKTDLGALCCSDNLIKLIRMIIVFEANYVTTYRKIIRHQKLFFNPKNHRATEKSTNNMRLSDHDQLGNHPMHN